jgi:hypothetical protein
MASGTRRWRRVWMVSLAMAILIGFFTRDLWWPSSEDQPSGPTKLDLKSYDGVIQLAKAGPEEPGSPAEYWKRTLTAAGTPFTPPAAYQPYVPPRLPSSACVAPANGGKNNAFHCPKDHTVSWHDEWFRSLHNDVGPYAPLMVLAHEWGHHISSLRGRHTVFDKQEELQADCFAGMYSRYAFAKLNLPLLELRTIAHRLLKSGDKYGTRATWFAPGVHGKWWERTGAFSLGFFARRLKLCETYQQVGSKHIASIGQYPMAVAPDTRIDAIDPDRVRLRSGRGQAHVGFLQTRPPVAPSNAFKQLRDKFFFIDGASDVRSRFLQSHTKTPGMVRYERRYVDPDGGRVTLHGVLAMISLREGRYIGLDTFEEGQAPPADAESWRPMEEYLETLKSGIRR